MKESEGLTFDKDIERIFTVRGIANILISAFLLLFAISLGTFIHESGHAIAAAFFSCKYNMSSNVFTGATAIECPFEGVAYNRALILISLAGPLLAFAVGTILYFMTEHGFTRSAGALIWIISVIPSLSPFLPMADMHVAIQAGLNPIVGWMIFLLITGFCAYHYFIEMQDVRWIV